MRQLIRTVLSAPESAVVLLASAVGAVWAVNAGPFPGTELVARWPLAGSILVFIAWFALYGFLAHALLRSAAVGPPRQLLFRLALVLFVLVLASPLAYFAESNVLFRTRYSKYLYLIAVAALAVRFLLWRETKNLWDRAAAKPASALAASVFLAMLIAAFAVAAVDLLLLIDGDREQKYKITWAAYAANTLLLGSLYLIAFAVTARLWSAILAGSAAYLVLGFSNLAKMTYMHAAVQPLDLLYIAEFMPQFRSTFGFGPTLAMIVIGAAFAFCMFRSWRLRSGVPAVYRAGIAGLALAVLFGASVSQRYEPVRTLLAAAGIDARPWDSILSARRNGVLYEFFSYLPDLVVSEPADYSAETVASVVKKYRWSNASASGAPSADGKAAGSDVSVIVYMIESFMDPLELGVPLTADPIPTLRALSATHSSGYAIVPGRFGESASSEFEVLTGMSMSFLPERSVAYKQHIRRRIPSLPCLLRDSGYSTVAIQADPIEFFNRSEVYEHLCFERIGWLYENPQIPRSITGAAPSDEAVVDAIVAEVEAAHPAFVFAFPSSTHHPYRRNHFVDSRLDLVNPSASVGAQELKYYVNALQVADAAVKKLVDHFAASEREVVIAILGDHLPPLSAEALAGFYQSLPEDVQPLDRMLRERRVPIVVWSNFEREREDLYLSLNLLAPYLLGEIGIEPAGFLGFVDQFRRNVTLLSNHVAGSEDTRWSEEAMIPERYRVLIDDYRLLQHDALFGGAYLEYGIEAAYTRDIAAR